MNDSPLPPNQLPFLRTVRSFVLRAGRTTAGQAKAFTDVGPRFLLPYTAQPLDFAACFERQAPTILEIGFGMGEATAQIAALRPQDNFLCCEVHTPGVGALLKRIAEQSLTNIRIVQHDAVEVIDHMLPLQSLDGAHIFFPDPWHKARHASRRFVNQANLDIVASLLKPGAEFRIGSDDPVYIGWALAHTTRHPSFKWLAEKSSDWLVRPDDWPPSRYEQKAIRQGRVPHYFRFERV